MMIVAVHELRHVDLAAVILDRATAMQSHGLGNTERAVELLVPAMHEWQYSYSIAVVIERADALAA